MAMAFASLRREDKTGLAVAVVLHLLLVGVLVFRPTPDPMPVPERMVVSLAEDVGLASEAPELIRESRASTAPTLSEEQAPTIEAPDPQRAVEERPSPERPEPRETRREVREAPPSRTDSGASRQFDQAFSGAGSSSETSETRVPAAQIGASARASIVQAIVRQIRPHWTAPTGVDAELLITELSFDLDENGSLKGRPRVLRQSGVNASNRPQANLHAERAVRAVQLAAPFNLPDEYYEAWKSIRGARFDRNLSR